MGLFSIQTITALIEAVTGGADIGRREPIGKYRTGPQLEQFLGAAGIELHIGNSSRVPSVRHVITQANEMSTDAIVRLIEQVADPREYLELPGKGNSVVEYLNARLNGDGFELKEISGKCKLTKLGTTGAAAIALTKMANQLAFESVQADFERALTQAETDPEDAVTSACSTLESVYKCLLDEMKQSYPSNQDIAGLAQAVENSLNLSPGREDIEPDIKRILGGLANVSRGIGALRTHCGDAHGRGKGVNRIDSRIARLAIHSASTTALFFIETWQKKIRVNPC
jgi:hypothetical protein